MISFLKTALILISFNSLGSETLRPQSTVFEITPIKLIVKGKIARFLIKAPDNFKIDSIDFQVRNAGRLFEKPQPYQKIKIIQSARGSELKILIKKLPPGFYQLFVKINDSKKNEYYYQNKYKNYINFIVDRSIDVKAPDPVLNNDSIKGIDSDHDGIRDDIQIWINETFSSHEKLKMSMRVLATSKQLRLTTSENKAQSILSIKKMLNDLTCLCSIAGLDQGSNLGKRLEEKLLNTKDRLHADIKASSNFSGQSWELPDTVEEQQALCSFNPEEL